MQMCIRDSSKSAHKNTLLTVSNARSPAGIFILLLTARAVSYTHLGMFVGQSLVGGYMYLRSLIGPEQLLYKF